MPLAPTDPQDRDTVQSGWGTTATDGKKRTSSDRRSKLHDDEDDFVEATRMIRNAQGEIEFVAQTPTSTPSCLGLSLLAVMHDRLLPVTVEVA